MRQTFAPVFRQQFAFLREDINIGHLVEGDDVGFQPLQDGVRLFRGAGMLLGDFHVRVFLLIQRVVLDKEFARDVVGGVEQLFISGKGRRALAERRRRGGFFSW
ncbi:hypothetical protein HMPREF9080_00954 [Cardiobacterium valvarum F0432]|uniref:Uncharacterized protein n=1 Tax=Cardiobacterium valvarum F0432 TaxID=797473 RepID=G9ZDX0_9GAMM|nr:hypothetical protein HMPREF9080_00954 [Cardiobacterium valvarum F0432]